VGGDGSNRRILRVKQDIGPETTGKPEPNSGQVRRTRSEQSQNESGVSLTLPSQQSPVFGPELVRIEDVYKRT